MFLLQRFQDDDVAAVSVSVGDQRKPSIRIQRRVYPVAMCLEDGVVPRRSIELAGSFRELIWKVENKLGMAWYVARAQGELGLDER